LRDASLDVATVAVRDLRNGRLADSRSPGNAGAGPSGLFQFGDPLADGTRRLPGLRFAALTESHDGPADSRFGAQRMAAGVAAAALAPGVRSSVFAAL
jgi:hypothetical protein